MKINTVTVLGANGIMGSNVAGIFASFGKAKVYLVCRTLEKSNLAIEKSVASVKCDSIKRNLEAADYSMLEKCISNSDLVFESVVENLEVKKGILKSIAEYAKPDCVICSGTSGLSIKELASVLPDNLKRRFLGMHMFNPPYTLRLCEIILTEHVDMDSYRQILEYAEKQLNRRVVETKDTPGFLGNRIGFQFINKAIQYADIYKERGGIDYIDSILGKFTGRTMPPILTADFVGLDTHKSIVDYIYANTDDDSNSDFVLPFFVNELIAEGKLGQKVNEGFYKKVIVDGQKKRYVYDIEIQQYRPTKEYNFPFSMKMRNYISEGNYTEAFSYLATCTDDEAQICKEFLFDYVRYACIANKEAGKGENALNDVMAYGFNWCPPAGIVTAFGGKVRFIEIMEPFIAKYSNRKMQIKEIFNTCCLDNMDYRKFLKV